MGRHNSRKIAVAVGAWRERTLVLSLARAGARLGVAGLLLIGANNSLQNAVAEGDTRTLSFHHVHTGEDITVTFKRDGRYDEAALKKLDWFMRDWRKEQETHMDPHLFDLLWEVNRDVGGKEPIQVICGYRSPGTNAMLRRRSNGVAQFSQHINGNAIDFYIPGVPLAAVRAEGLRLQLGGVGFYPTSGSPFVHMDTGTIRHWPRIAREELVKIFPNGRTVHIPADGHPLPGYALALADVERHGAVPSETSLEAARAAGVITAGQEQVAARAQAQPAGADFRHRQEPRPERRNTKRAVAAQACARAHGGRQPEPAEAGLGRADRAAAGGAAEAGRGCCHLAAAKAGPTADRDGGGERRIRQPRLLARRGRDGTGAAGADRGRHAV